MTFDEGPVCQSGDDRGKSREKAPTRGDAQPSEDEDEERRDSDLDHEGENVGPPSHAGQRKLKRAGLQLPVGVQRCPTRREELLAAMHEVEEIARVGRAIVGRQGRSRRDHGKPNACRRRARDLPHSGRYRPRKGDG